MGTARGRTARRDYATSGVAGDGADWAQAAKDDSVMHVGSLPIFSPASNLPGNGRSAAVVTIGSKAESFGALKLAAWLTEQGWNVTQTNKAGGMFDRYDLWAFSCVFSWKLPELVEQVKAAQLSGGEIWIGGPAVTFGSNAAWVQQQTGIKPHVGLDQRFERQAGNYPMVYFSRGCPAYTPACGHCPVPKIEGTSFTFYPDARPAPLLMDNNLSALPTEYQDHIIRRYTDDWRGGLVDCNSGFEPHTFTAETMERWESFPLRFWRFGYDDLSERDQSLEMIRLLKSRGHQGERVRVYCLIGNEPVEACRQRLMEIVAGGMCPWPQRVRPLNWREGPLPVRYDWTEPKLIAFQRFYSLRALWGKLKPEEFFYNGAHWLAQGAA